MLRSTCLKNSAGFDPRSEGLAKGEICCALVIPKDIRLQHRLAWDTSLVEPPAQKETERCSLTISNINRLTSNKFCD